MNYLKILGLGAVAVLALLIVGAGTASATVLCKTTTNPCEGHHPAETAFEAGLIGVVFTTPFNINTCESSTMSGITTTTGSASETVAIFIKSLSFEECSCSNGANPEVKVLELPSLEIHHLSETDNGLVTVEGLGLTVRCTDSKVACIFKTVPGKGEDGELEGGEEPVLHLKVRLSWSAGDSPMFSCGFIPEIIWEADYRVESPSPTYVMPG